MKIKYLIPGLLAMAFAFAGCEDTDDLVFTKGDISELVVKGWLVSDDKTEYSATIDEAAATITVQVPYYISDTEAIQGDLTQMKVRASMPVGAKFEPGLSGIHDLSEGIQRTLTLLDGSSKTYTIKAVYYKSSKARLTRVTLAEAPNAVIAIKDPETAGGVGTVTVYKTSSSLDGALKSASLAISPWATFETSALNPDGTIDLSGKPEIYVVAQDGTKCKYVTEINTPSLVEPGKAGYISLLFGYQITPDNPRGFEATQNRTMAVVGDHLVISSTKLDFVVLNRYTGAYLENVKVNTTGLPTGVIQAITQDDAGHMIAVAFAAVNNKWVANRQFEIYAWKDGIASAPVTLFSEDLLDSEAFAQFRSTNAAVAATGTWDIGRMVSVRGDITGDAMLMTLANSTMNRLLRVKFEGGKVASVLGSARGLNSWGNQSKPIPLSLEDECAYLLQTSNQLRMFYTPKTGEQVTITQKGNWWGDALLSQAYTEFNGMKLLAVNNTSGVPTQYARLCVGDISSLSADSFKTSQIMDSRLDNYDPAKGPMGPNNQNATLTGMTSFYGALGKNSNGTGDVAFGKSADGNAVQVYMLTTDHGVLAYEITRYDI